MTNAFIVREKKSNTLNSKRFENQKKKKAVERSRERMAVSKQHTRGKIGNKSEQNDDIFVCMGGDKISKHGLVNSFCLFEQSEDENGEEKEGN